MADIVELLPPSTSRETIDMLAAMLVKARSGEMLGAAVVVLHPGRQFSLHISGIARDDPTYVRGILCKFDDLLAVVPEKDA